MAMGGRMAETPNIPVPEERPEKNNIPRAETPTEADLFYAIKEHLYQNHGQLLYLRMQIWRMGNKKKMSNTEMFNSEDEASRWRENAEALVKLLNKNTAEGRLMLAELHRNLGDFDGCRNLLKTIKDNDYAPVVNRLNEECESGTSLTN